MERHHVVSMILAAGRGTRINSRQINKVVYRFNGRPMIEYAVELLEQISGRIVVVVGAYADSVKEALKNHKNIIYAKQKEQLGTGHAVQIGIGALYDRKPSVVLVGYGDHMMFYAKKGIEKLIKLHKKNNSIISFITTIYKNPNELAWGRIERDAAGNVLDIVEQRDATAEQKKIEELNAGFYCFDFDFLSTHLRKIHKSPITKEYYLTDLIKIACQEKLAIVAMPLPFDEVGIGINRHEELEQSQKLFKDIHKN